MDEIATTELSVKRTIRAAPAEVYGVWLDARSPGSPWFGTAAGSRACAVSRSPRNAR